jgi:hypothetical protein
MAFALSCQPPLRSAVKLMVELGAGVKRSDAVGIAALYRMLEQCKDN